MKKIWVLFTAFALVLAFSFPAAAAVWDFYGSARIATFYQDYDEEAGDKQDLQWDLQSNSRLGANVKNGAIGGAFEYGTGVNLRKLYGTWNFGGGELLVGQTYTPMTVFNSNQVFDADNGLIGFGALYTGRHPMIQLKTGGLKVALVNVHADTDLGTDGGTEKTLPKLELAYGLNAGPVGLTFVGGYQTYAADPNGVDENVSSYIGGLNAKFGMGPVTLHLDGWYGQNVGQYGFSNHGADEAVLDGSSVEDTNSYGGVFVVNYKASSMVSVEVGAGYVNNESDVTGVEDDDGMSYYGNAMITLAPGFFIVPEVGIFDFGDDTAGADEGKLTYVGAKWQINF